MRKLFAALAALSVLLMAVPASAAWPAAPTSPTVTPTESGIVLTWVPDPTPPATSHDIFRSTLASSGYKKINTAPVVGNTYTDTTALPGVTYYYKVRSVGSVTGFSGLSVYVSGSLASAPPPVVAVTVAPTTASVQTGATQQFTATVTGSTNTTVAWGATCGTVSSSGLFTAPTTAGSCNVTATSAADTTKSATATVTVTAPAPDPDPEPTPTPGPIDVSVVPAHSRDTWSPGIPGGIPTTRVVHATLSGLTANGTGDQRTAIQTAIDAASAAYKADANKVIREVVLPAGTFRVAGTIYMRSGVVLKGQGLTSRIRCDVGGDTDCIRFAMNQWTDYPSNRGPWNLAVDAVKGTKSFQLPNTVAGNIQVGDILAIDEEDDTTYIRIEDAIYEKRQPTGDTHGPRLRVAGAWRSVSDMIRVVGKTAGATNTTFTLADPLHNTFNTARYAQVYHVATEYSDARSTMDGISWVGVENLYVTGGPIGTNNVAFCWIKNVEVDGNPGTVNIGTYTNRGGITGRSVDFFHAYRCEMRGSYVHHSRSISQGGGAYLVSLSSYTSETLIEDNIIIWGNKLMVANMSGGGNVIAYNYVDNARTSNQYWQEGAIDLNHQAFTHGILVEGNYSMNLVSDTTHGNAGYHVFFRNYATGRNSAPLWGDYPYRTDADRDFMRAAGTDGNHREVTYIGNVLKTDATGADYQVDYICNWDCLEGPTIWRIGEAFNGEGGSFVNGKIALDLTYRHGNWDSVTNGIRDWDANNTQNLPASLYLTAKPAFFGANTWPWVNPKGATAADRLKVLPAKARFDAKTYIP